MLKFDILNRFTGAVQFTAEIDCEADASTRVKLGLAIKWAIKSGADLSGANLIGADLSRAYLSRANLSRANLSRADLSGADLIAADLSGAYLSRADLSRAYLSGADLSGANLSRADLSGADLSGADLSGANLIAADLSRAYLSGADLSGAKNAELVIAQTRILPEGALIGWKKCLGGVIVKLRIPSDAKRSHAFGRKCRAEFVDVIEVFGAEVGLTRAHGPETTYRAGSRVTPDSFGDDWQNECSNGIHFFITRAEAENY